MDAPSNRGDLEPTLSINAQAARDWINGERRNGTGAVTAHALLNATEHERDIHLFNPTPDTYSQGKLIHELFEEQVRSTPNAVAVVCQKQLFTYVDLNRKANQLAWYLRSKGVGPEKKVGVFLERSFEMVVGLLAILKAGGAYVPLDPDYPSERLHRLVRDAEPELLLIQGDLRSRLPRTAVECIALDEDRRDIRSCDKRNLNGQYLGLDPGNLAYVIYTSGSTGSPKGAMNEHRGVVNRLHWMQREYHLCQHDRVLQKTPFSFDVSVWEFFWTLMSGATLVVSRPAGHRDPVYLKAIIEAEGITTIHFVPSMLQSFLDVCRHGECSSLAHIVCSGEELPRALQKRCFECFPWVKLSNLYGPTEAAVDVTSWECSPDDAGLRVPIGRPITNIQIYILDPQGHPVRAGEPGELFIGGIGVGRGYLNRPELTADRFVPDPFSVAPEGRLYRTGDLARWRADGAVEYLGRNDYQVKIRGFRIELGEIEAQLARDSEVKEVVVVVREDNPGEKRLVGYVTANSLPHGNDHLHGVWRQQFVSRLRVHLRASLPAHMVPAALVVLERFPLTSNGKLDRRALPAPHLSAYGTRRYEAPEGEMEEKLVSMWQEILHIDRVGRQDNFFELGGHSLLIARLIGELRRTGLTAEARDVFENPTIVTLAKTLRRDTAERAEVPPNLIYAGCDSITPKMLPLVALDQSQVNHVVNAIPGGAGNIQDIYPLSPLQEGMLFHHRLHEQSGDAYVLLLLFRFVSEERVNQLIHALQGVINRHDALRTLIMWERLPRPVQVVCRRAKLVADALTLDRGTDVQIQLSELMKPGKNRLDLRRAPLMRLQIVNGNIAGDRYAILQIHHIVIDHASLNTILGEVGTFVEGRELELPEPAPFRNHIARALAYTREGVSESFFRAKLGDVNELTAPFRMTDVHGSGSDLNEFRETLEDSLAFSIRMEARRLTVSASTLFHAAWALVIARLSARDDVVYGTVLLGQLQGGVDQRPAVGMFVNTLPLRLRLRDVMVTDLVRSTWRELAQLSDHEHAALPVVQSYSGLPAAAPIFTSLLNYLHGASSVEATQFHTASGIEFVELRQGINYPMSMSVSDNDSEFVLTALTDKRIEPARIVGYFRKALQSLVVALEDSQDRPALMLDILPDAEREWILERFNATQASYPSQRLIHEQFEDQQRRTPDAIALVFEEESLTYAELNRRSNQLAGYLRDNGIAPDQVVGVLMERSLDMVISLLAILKAGGAYLPLDPKYPQDRLHYMVGDAAPNVLLTQRSLRERLAKTAVTLSVDTEWDKVSHHGVGNLSAAGPGILPDHLAYVIYTSGSTGAPKGVMIEHRCLSNLVAWHVKAFGLDVGCRSSSMASVAFDASTWEIWPALCSGGKLLLASVSTQNDSEALLQWWQNVSVDVSFLPTPLAELAYATQRINTGTESVLIGGDRLRRWPERLPVGQKLINNYGPSETTVVATSGELSDQDRVLHIGRPISNTKLYILDATRQPVPIGVEGEIYISGLGVSRGYLNRPGLTAERFIAKPFGTNSQERMYKTGDLARWRTDGTIEYLGRNDEQVKIRGFRVELGEIEARLARHPEVEEAVVLVREDARSERRLAAYVVLKERLKLREVSCVGELREYLKASLPEYMIPSALVLLDSLPLTQNGKLNRRALHALGLESSTSRLFEPPQEGMETALAGIWQHLLQVDRVSRRDSFFELGGHSLLVLEAVDRINQAFGVSLKIADAYKHPTIAELAARVRGSEREDSLIELTREAVLDRGIVAMPGAPRTPPAAVLLTGGTGFVGRFLLAQLLQDTDATIYCLVRASSEDQASSRLREMLLKWRLGHEHFGRRVVSVQGDLRLPQLGLKTSVYDELCQTIDSIYHCGASMNHLETYAMARPANVGGAAEILKIATTRKPKLINYISTLGVFNGSPAETPRVVSEETPIEFERHLSTSGYTGSKWVGEKIFRTASARGIPCNVFRLGLVSADTRKGRYDELQREYRIFKSCLISGRGIRNYRFDLPPTPVDYVARAIVFLSNRHIDGNGIFHISSSSGPTRGIFEHYNEVMSQPLRLIPLFDWVGEIKKLHETGHSLPAVPLVEAAFDMDKTSFAEYERRTALGATRFDCSRTHRELESVGIVAPVMDEKLLAAYLEGLISQDSELRAFVSYKRDVEVQTEGARSYGV